jgi:hypothetical protein
MELRQSILSPNLTQADNDFIFDDLHKLQISFKNEQELSKMFSRLFDMQIT